MNAVNINVHVIDTIEIKTVEHGNFQTVKVKAYDENGVVVSEVSHYSRNGEEIDIRRITHE